MCEICVKHFSQCWICIKYSIAVNSYYRRGTVLRTSYALTHLILTKSNEVDSITSQFYRIPILQMRKLRPTEIDFPKVIQQVFTGLGFRPRQFAFRVFSLNHFTILLVTMVKQFQIHNTYYLLSKDIQTFPGQDLRKGQDQHLGVMKGDHGYYSI